MLTVSCIYQLSTKSFFYVIMHHKKKIRHYVLCPMTDLNVKQIQKYPIVEKIPHCRKYSNVKCQHCRKGQIWFPSTQIHDRWLSGFGTGTSIKSGGFKPVSSKLFKDNSIIILFQHKLSINILTVLLAGWMCYQKFQNIFSWELFFRLFW